jgi:hypothetical protein
MKKNGRAAGRAVPGLADELEITMIRQPMLKL